MNQPTCDIIRKEKKTFQAELLDNVSPTSGLNLYHLPVILLEKKKTFQAELSDNVLLTVSDNVSLTMWFEFISPTCDIIKNEQKVPSRTV